MEEEDLEASIAAAEANYEAVEVHPARESRPARSGTDEDSIDPGNVHATDRTYGAAIRTIFQLLILSVAIGRQYTVSTTVVSGFFIAYALAMLIFAGIRHHRNMRSVKRGIVRVDGISPLFFFALAIGATTAALVYTINRLTGAEQNTG